ncbi:cytochrome P450 [Perilla frutescens var. hirtella]|nr:cytochrome P450 [Perilla frutescens var. hirtella]
MEPAASCFLQYFEESWLILISLLSFWVIICFKYYYSAVRRRVVLCNCEVCETYIESRWSRQFPNLCDWVTHLLKNSPNRTVHIHVLNNTITANPDNVEYMLKTRFHNFPKGKPFSAILGDFLGRGIFNVDGNFWKFQRKMASLELGRLSTRAYLFEVVNQEIHRRLLPLMMESSSTSSVSNSVDLQDVFRRFSFVTISRFSFGLDPNCLDLSLPLSEFIAAFDLASKLSAERALASSPIAWKIKRWLNIGSERELRRAIKTVHVVARDFIRQRRKLGFSDQQDLLSRFMSSVSDERFLVDIIVSFLLAGRDTVASALTSFFWLVAQHPEVEAAILVETEREKSGCGCGQGHYLHAAVYESMRLYPPIQFDSKYSLDDDVLPDGSFVKRGTRVTYHPYAMGRMEEIWGSDCFQFKPERWIRDGVFFHEQNSFKCPIFQAGIRVCLGKELALMQLKTVAISLLQRFHIQLLHQTDNPPRFSPGLTATFRDGLKLVCRLASCG